MTELHDNSLFKQYMDSGTFGFSIFINNRLYFWSIFGFENRCPRVPDIFTSLEINARTAQCHELTYNTSKINEKEKLLCRRG